MILSKANVMPLISTFKLNEIQDDEWEIIKKYKYSYIVEDNSHLNRLLYPGFIFSSDDAAKYYEENVLSNIVNNIKSFTTPRGNLSKSNNIFIVGHRPGTFTAHLSKAESAWLLGPSSKMLIKACKDLEIYPYFTNFYYSHNSLLDKNSDNIFNELSGIIRMYKELYDIRNFRFLFLGSYYEEFGDLKNRLNNLGIHDTFFYYLHAWHPSYILRINTDEIYKKWLLKIKEQLENK